MRTARSVALVLTMVAAACSPRRPLAPVMAPVAAPAAPADLAPAATSTPAPPAPATDLFQAEVKPLLSAKCSPCHAPGGVMYVRMPFDDPATVREHEAGIRRRLKAEAAVIDRWLASTR